MLFGLNFVLYFVLQSPLYMKHEYKLTIVTLLSLYRRQKCEKIYTYKKLWTQKSDRQTEERNRVFVNCDVTVDQSFKASKVKVKLTLRTGHEDPDGEYSYSSTLSLTSALDGVGDQRHAPAALTPGNVPVPIV